MNVTVCSAFRDATRYLDRYLEQLEDLRDALHHRNDDLAVVWGEGDSTDNTYIALDYELLMGRFAGVLVDVSHGGPVFGPIVDETRFRQLAYVWGCIWQRISPESDAVLFVESDLIWEADTLLSLVDHLAEYPAVAPRVMDGPASFYDVWAFRNGQEFTKEPPYHPALNGAMLQLESAGSCLAIRGELARCLTWPAADVIVGVCAQINRLGGSVWVDSSLEVLHEC